MSDDHDSTELVRRGYDELSYRYRADDGTPQHYAMWVTDLASRVPARGAVLDLGCGCGVPLTRDLSRISFVVTGIDISEVQVQRARILVPNATFLRDDMTSVVLPSETFDAVICLYAIIHVPIDQQQAMIAKIATWLRPGGWLLMAAAEQAWTGSVDRWLGGDSTMWWSQADADSYHRWIVDAGLVVVEHQFIPEEASGHSLFWARRPSSAS